MPILVQSSLDRMETHGDPTEIPWRSHGDPMVIPWRPHGDPMNINGNGNAERRGPMQCSARLCEWQYSGVEFRRRPPQARPGRSVIAPGVWRDVSAQWRSVAIPWPPHSDPLVTLRRPLDVQAAASGAQPLGYRPLASGETFGWGCLRVGL
eukprot:gene12514-biopygen31